jgi:hypothetical protein
MKKILWGLLALCIAGAAFAFTRPAKKGTMKIYRYQLSDASHVFDGVSPYWVEVAPGNECDPIDPTLPCTVEITIGNGSGEFANLDAFLDQFSSVSELLSQDNVTGKDE